MRLRARSAARLTAVLVVAGFVLSGGTAAPTARAADPQRGGTLTLLKQVEQGNGWDPIRLIGIPAIGETPQQFAFYDALFYADPATLKLVPRLGTALTTSDGGTTWTLKLRPNVKFSDGTVFDAEAVKFNWLRIADPANRAGGASSANVIQSMDVVDPLTMKITLKAPNPVWHQLVVTKLAWIGSPTAIKALGTDFGNKPVGAGPFMLQQWIRDSQYTLVRNPNYWEKGRPYLDQIVIKIILDESAIYNTYKTGGGEITYLVDPAFWNQARQEGYKLIAESTNGGGWSLEFNTTKAPFNDVRVRQAIDLAIDRKQFNEIRRFGDKSALMDTLELPGTTFYNPKIKVAAVDLTAAQKLIDQYVNENGGKPIVFTIEVFSNQFIQQDAQLLQLQIQKLKNVTVNLEVLAAAALIAKRTAGDFQAEISTTRWNEPATDFVNYFLTGSTGNFARYSNPTLDATLNQLRTATDQKTRVQLTHTAEQQVLKDSVELWYSLNQTVQLVNSKKVKGYATYYDHVILLDDVWMSTKK